MSKKRLILITLGVTLSFLVFLPHTEVLDKVGSTFSPKAVLEKKSELSKAEEVKPPPKKDHSLEKSQLIADLTATMGINQNFGLAIYDINNSEFFGINETQSFHSASVTKILVATAALSDVESGKYSLDQPAGGYTFSWHLQQMINQSNNNSWDYFNNLLGFQREQEEAGKLKLTGANLFETHMTAQGVAELLLKLYKGEALSIPNRDLLFSHMVNTETENRISTGIPPGVSFYHKTGTFGGGIHDAALVIHPKNPFILTIFTNDVTGLAWETRFGAFKTATEAVYTYFSTIE